MSSKITATGNVYWPREAYEFITNQVTKKSAGDFLKSQLLKYQLQAEDWEELYQYLKTIEGEFDSWIQKKTNKTYESPKANTFQTKGDAAFDIKWLEGIRDGQKKRFEKL